MFKNKYTNNWSQKIFIIDKLLFTNGSTYKIRDLSGEEMKDLFYKYEVIKNKIRMSKRKNVITTYSSGTGIK